MLLDKPIESHPLESNVELPAPSMLRRKIIIKNKKKHHHHHHKKNATASAPNNASNANAGKRTLAKMIAEGCEEDETGEEEKKKHFSLPTQIQLSPLM